MPRLLNYDFTIIYFVAATFGAKPIDPRAESGPKPIEPQAELGAKPNEPFFPRLKPPWQAISGVFP